MTHPLELLHLDPLSRLANRLQDLVQHRLWLKVLLAMLAGVAVGLLLGRDVALVPPAFAQPLVAWLALPGHLFLALIRMIVVPLVFASVVRGLTASESVEQLRRMGLRALAFFLATTVVATVVGIGLAFLLRPGRTIDADALTRELGSDSAAREAIRVVDLPSLSEVPQVLTNLLPDNPLASLAGGEMLQIILFAVLMGVALLSLAPNKSAPLYDLLGSLQDVSMTVVQWAMRLAPVAVFGLMAQLTASVGLGTLGGMGAYVGVVLLGLATLMVGYLGLLWMTQGLSPRQFLRQARELLLLAFSTSSSAAVMPMTVRTVKSLGVSQATAQFVVPLGATINMTGTALYQGVATVFMAQVFGVDLPLTSLLLVVVTTVAASIGSPATPGVGIVILASVIQSVGIPAEGVVLLLGVDRMLDMSRTVVNVMGDIAGCLVLDPAPSGQSPTADVPGSAPEA
ncbi:MAG: dicarboxylate/amino acid:cation symporter [Deltaproteobacteria bacterium]|nr:dicarboxylate/amino acid:cation symporter [Deltaproteobacteria bacterium]